MAADGLFCLLNGYLGLVGHNYYQRDELYIRVFKATWDRLRSEGVVRHSLESIDDSDVFNYSPYRSLSRDQRQGLLGFVQTDRRLCLAMGIQKGARPLRH